MRPIDADELLERYNDVCQMCTDYKCSECGLAVACDLLEYSPTITDTDKKEEEPHDP